MLWRSWRRRRRQPRRPPAMHCIPCPSTVPTIRNGPPSTTSSTPPSTSPTVWPPRHRDLGLRRDRLTRLAALRSPSGQTKPLHRRLERRLQGLNRGRSLPDRDPAKDGRRRTVQAVRLQPRAMTQERRAVVRRIQRITGPALGFELSRPGAVPPVVSQRVRWVELQDFAGRWTERRVVDERRSEAGFSGRRLSRVSANAALAGHPAVVSLDVREPCEDVVDGSLDRALELEVDDTHAPQDVPLRGQPQGPSRTHQSHAGTVQVIPPA